MWVRHLPDILRSSFGEWNSGCGELVWPCHIMKFTIRLSVRRIWSWTTRWSFPLHSKSVLRVLGSLGWWTRSTCPKPDLAATGRACASVGKQPRAFGIFPWLFWRFLETLSRAWSIFHEFWVWLNLSPVDRLAAQLFHSDVFCRSGSRLEVQIQSLNLTLSADIEKRIASFEEEAAKARASRPPKEPVPWPYFALLGRLMTVRWSMLVGPWGDEDPRLAIEFARRSRRQKQMVPWCSSFLGCFLCAFGDCMIACICRAQMGSIDCGFMMICGYCWYIYIYIRINIYEYSWWFMMIYGYSCLGKTTTRRSRGWSKMDPRGAGPKSACRIMAPGRGRIRLRC